MKNTIPPRPRIIDALASGLTAAAKRPWLLLIPLMIDLMLWLAPVFSIDALLQRLWRGWESIIRATYTPGQMEMMGEMLRTTRESITLVGSRINLLDGLVGSWFSAPSVVATGQVTRLDFISEMILAPAGVAMDLPRLARAPWQTAAIEVSSPWAALLMAAALWFVAQLVAVLWLHWAAAGAKVQPADPATSNANETERQRNPQPAGALIVASDPHSTHAPQLADRSQIGGYLEVAGQLILFSFTLGVIMFMLRLPLGFATALLLVSGSPLLGALFALVGGITLWITLWLLLSLFFTSEGVLLERQPIWRSMLQGAVMTRGNAMSTLGLLGLINLLLVGFRVVWGALGQNPAGMVIAIIGNAYLATAMMLAVFTYYRGLYARFAALQAEAKAKAEQAPQSGK